MTSNTNYYNHPLNKSPSKTSYSFSRNDRFMVGNASTYFQLISRDVFYNISPVKNNRTTTFGYGNRDTYIQK
jgi:hypothetical protein